VSTSEKTRRETPSRDSILKSFLFVALGFGLGLGFADWTGGSNGVGDHVDLPTMERAVRDAMSEAGAFDRSKALSQLFSALDASNVDGAARGMRTGAMYLDPIDLQLLLSAWTRFDPIGAMGAAERWPSQAGREIGTRIVMREWAASGRVLAAVNYYQTIRDPERASMLAGPLVRGWALSGDFEGALDALRRLWDRDESVNPIDGFVRGALMESGPEKLIERVMALDPVGAGALEQRLMRVTLNLGADENPVAAAEAYAKLEGDTPPEWLHGALQGIAIPRAEGDPEATIEWLLERADRPERTVVLKEIMRGWAKRDLDGAWQWWQAANDPGEAPGAEQGALRRILLPPLLRNMAEFRPAEAALWVEHVEKPRARQVLIQRIAYHWTRHTPEAAQAWVDSLSLAEEDLANARLAIDRGRRAIPDLEEDDEE
jgi:hypothetical protein